MLEQSLAKLSDKIPEVVEDHDARPVEHVDIVVGADGELCGILKPPFPCSEPLPFQPPRNPDFRLDPTPVGP